MNTPARTGFRMLQIVSSLDWAHVCRWAAIALGTLTLCACRSAEKGPALSDGAPTPEQAALIAEHHGVPTDASVAVSMGQPAHAADTSRPPRAAPHGAMPVSAQEPAERAAATHPPVPREPMMAEGCPPWMAPYQNMPLPYQPRGPWAPPGIKQPWPPEEYVRDGGDEGVPAAVGRQWRAYGVDPEDTVAHFDTLDGKTIVEPSNQVHIYAPRFGAVRQVVGAAANKQNRRATGVYQPEKLAGPSTLAIVGTNTQNEQVIDGTGVRLIGINQRDQKGGAIVDTESALGFDNRFKPYENLEVIRSGQMEMDEMAWLARSADAAVAWTDTEAVVVILDNQKAMAETQDQPAQQVFTVGEPPGDPKLRVIKVASDQFANPGDEIDFTIRFDNIGNQMIGNVAIIDNLSGRLEYIEDSAQCSLDAQFFTEPSESGSVVLRCEVDNPIEPGDGGVLRFRCRVR